MRSIWNKKEQTLFRRLNSAPKIQNYLDNLSYNTDEFTRSPRLVIRERKAHCFDGALFAAAALEFHGARPLLVDLRARDDDDHVLAVFQQRGLWGAIAKSNYVNTRLRDPVYRSVRELAMSYFHIYFNLTGKKTLREYSVPIDFTHIRECNWRIADCDLDILAPRLDSARHYSVIPRGHEKFLSIADDRTFRSETLGLNPAGAYKVKGSRL